MSGGIDLSTNDNDLLVDGLVQLTGGGTNLLVGGATSELNADNLTTGGGGTVELAGGALVLDEEDLLGGGAVTINAGGTLAGHGTVAFNDSPLFSSSLLSNNGTLAAFTRVSIIGQTPPPNTLAISGGGTLARIDLDGTNENGVVNVNRNQTLDINLALSDVFNGDINMFQGATLDMVSAWTLGDGTIEVDNGAFAGIPAVPAGVSTIAGGALTQTAGTITVVDNDGTLEFNAPFTMNGGNFVNNGLVVFDANATIGAGANFTMPTNSSSITVAANRIVTFNQANYNADGLGVPTNVLTINSAGVLTLNLGAGADELISCLVKLNGGGLHVNTMDNTWSIDGDIEVDANTGISQLSGEDLTLTSVNTTIGGNSTLRIAAPLTIAAAANFTGTGTLAFNQQVTVSAATTLNMNGGTVDLDGTDAVGDQILVQSPLVINAATMESFGRTNAGGGTNVIHVDALSAGAVGSLTVNIDDPNAEWTLNQQGTIAFSTTNALVTMLHGSDVNLNGSVNVVGSVGSAARVDIGGVVNLVNGAGGFLLQGGSFADPNRLDGGIINGPGELKSLGGRALVGRGTIGAPIDFDGTAELVAEGGTLNVNSVIDVGTVRVQNAAALNFGAAFDTTITAGGIVMVGGTLQGAVVTTAPLDSAAKSLRGVGTVSSQIVNSGFVEAVGGTLILSNASSDWDGGNNAGHLRASGGGTLQVMDNATFGFAGSVIAVENSRVVANGFALDFNPGSAISLDEATYQSTSSTDIGGTVFVGAGTPSTIKVENNFFLTFETGSLTTLNGNLRLENNNINIEQGAAFNGPGAFVIPDGSHLVADNQADIGVLLDMQGAFRPGNFNGIGRVDLLDYQQADAGELYVELIGTALNAFDRLVADGDVVLDGYLNIDIDEVSPGVPFVPSLGQTFNIITGNTVTGHFDYTDISGMPDGLTFHVSYLPNAVQLQVVNTPYYSADFDDDGDVDATDLAIWRNAFDLNQLGDADGDNDSDGEDFLIWQQQFGSIPGAGAALGATVPEPASAFLLLMGLAVAVPMCRIRCRERNAAVRESGMCKAGALSAIVCVVLFLTHSEVSYGQTIDISLNLQYTMPPEPAMGGNWTLVAKTNSINGIGSISAILSNVDAAGIAYQSGIGAMLKGGSPLVAQNGSLVELLYAQDVSNPASVVTDVGRGTGTPGNLVMDPFGDSYWNNAAVIATGTFGDTRPAFTANLDTPPDVTKGNVLATKTAPFFMAAAATVTTIVRDGLSVPLVGDYNLNGTVDAADYVMWRNTLGSPVTPSSGADGDGDGMIGSGDYDLWRAHFGATAGGGAAAANSSLSGSSVPEPSAWLLGCFAAAAMAALRRR
jgi:hypothetical protein